MPIADPNAVGALANPCTPGLTQAVEPRDRVTGRASFPFAGRPPCRLSQTIFPFKID